MGESISLRDGNMSKRNGVCELGYLQKKVGSVCEFNALSTIDDLRTVCYQTWTG